MISYHIWACEDIPKKLYSLKKKKQIVIYAAEEQIVNDDLDFDCIKPVKSIDFVLGGVSHPTYEKYRKVGNVHLWRNFWLYAALRKIDLSMINKPLNTKLFISLNNMPHWHRCRLMDILYKKELTKLGIISWHEPHTTPYKWEFWKPSRLILKDSFSENRLQHILPKQYNEALLNLIPESTEEGIFLTEKTWHAILAAKPFIILGGTGIHQYLEDQGFQLYTELFDYDFDKEENLEKRIDLITENLVRLANKDYNSLYNSVKEKCIYNKKLALDIVRNQKGIPDLALKFNYYNNVVKEAQCRLDILESAN